VNGRGPEPLERGQMRADGIALMLGEAIARILCIQLVHERIPSGFGQDRGSRNGQAQAVSLHDCLLWYREILESPSIEEEVLGHQGKAVHRAAHGKEPGPVNVDAIDLLDFGEGDRPCDSARPDLCRESVSRCRIELLRIIDAGNSRSGCEHDGRGRHGPGERAHAGFINAGDMQHAAGPKGAFKAQQLAQTLTLGPILHAAPRDSIQNGLRARARVGPQRGFGRGVERAGFDDDATMNLGEEEAHADNLAEIGWETNCGIRSRINSSRVVIATGAKQRW